MRGPEIHPAAQRRTGLCTATSVTPRCVAILDMKPTLDGASNLLACSPGAHLSRPEAKALRIPVSNRPSLMASFIGLAWSVRRVRVSDSSGRVTALTTQSSEDEEISTTLCLLFVDAQSAIALLEGALQHGRLLMPGTRPFPPWRGRLWAESVLYFTGLYLVSRAKSAIAEAQELCQVTQGLPSCLGWPGCTASASRPFACRGSFGAIQSATVCKREGRENKTRQRTSEPHSPRARISSSRKFSCGPRTLGVLFQPQFGTFLEEGGWSSRLS